jgi:serine/threonine-protein kinase HipA
MPNPFDDPAIAALVRLHESLDRKGPGSDAVTRALVERLRPGLPAAPDIVDMGCGSGHSAFLLASLLDAPVTAIDLCPSFIAELEAKRAARPEGARVTGRVADMADPGLAPASADLIWSEGAAYLVGVDRALADWQALLRPGGFLVFSECAWLVAAPPAEARAFFAGVYPEMRSPAGLLQAAEAAGWRFVAAEALPAAAWWSSYYDPLNARIAALQPDLAADDPMHAVIAEGATEQEMLRRYGDAYGYVFVVLQKP